MSEKNLTEYMSEFKQLLHEIAPPVGSLGTPKRFYKPGISGRDMAADRRQAGAAGQLARRPMDSTRTTFQAPTTKRGTQRSFKKPTGRVAAVRESLEQSVARDFRRMKAGMPVGDNWGEKEANELFVSRVTENLSDANIIGMAAAGIVKMVKQTEKWQKSGMEDPDVINKIKKTWNVNEKQAQRIFDKAAGLRENITEGLAGKVIKAGVKAVGKAFKESPIPKHSSSRGFSDEGVSSALKKSPRFKYSERFLKKWYTDK